jgi:hypothetical protein
LECFPVCCAKGCGAVCSDDSNPSFVRIFPIYRVRLKEQQEERDEL